MQLSLLCVPDSRCLWAMAEPISPALKVGLSPGSCDLKGGEGVLPPKNQCLPPVISTPAGS